MLNNFSYQPNMHIKNDLTYHSLSRTLYGDDVREKKKNLHQKDKIGETASRNHHILIIENYLEKLKTI